MSVSHDHDSFIAEFPVAFGKSRSDLEPSIENAVGSHLVGDRTVETSTPKPRLASRSEVSRNPSVNSKRTCS